ncbi:glycoside hydrolase family 15 protein [Kocuria aegyptia]|uniref:Glycoside hydrolase family 15 protein n=1 Tax=Kocuria aegyptia TaxID=330943 RepID=A0ABN2KQ65_9MICC
MAGGYLPIEDHAAIGNLRSVALVGRDGSIDWCPLPGLESASVFTAILDHRRGGRFQVRARGAEVGTQAYIAHTNVLETSFDTGEGRLVVTDCMPLRGNLDGVGGSTAEPAVHRLLRAEGGDVQVQVEWSPRFQYGNGLPQIMSIDGGFLAWAGDDALTLSGLQQDEATLAEEDGAATLRAGFTLGAGQRRALVTRWGANPAGSGLDDPRDVVTAAVESWRAWVHKAEATGSRAWAAPHEELIIRAELVLKLLTHGETGAIAAAATTSLPEEVGGVRNWDYRYSWIRDAALAAQALHALGHDAEAHAFVEWVERVAREHHDEDRAIQIVYGVHGEAEIGEKELPNLEGYRRSAPVRTGNGAVDQLQLDVFGELIGVVYELVRVGENVSDDILEFLPDVADDACRQWQERDYGLWELRNGPFHFVYSKVMVWMGLDRAITLAEAGLIDGDVQRWRATSEQIREEVLQQGFDPELGAFRQSYERNVLDASNLLFPLLEFLPFDDPRVRSTIDATIEGLTDNGLAHRYHADDGIAGGEGAFGLCNFWLVDALAMSGRTEEARDLFGRMVSHANHVGLYAEEIDPATGAFLGNFPQAFTHIGLINSALYLAYAEGRDSPVPDPIGSEEHRNHRMDSARQRSAEAQGE